MTIASPGVVSWTAHGLLANDSIVFSTTGALPTGLTAGSHYYVKTILSSSTFTVSGSYGGTVIATTGTQSGTQTAVGTVRMATAATPWSVTARVNIADNGANCVTFSIENSTSTLAGGNGTGNGGYLLPANTKVFRIIANKYQAFIFQPSPTSARSFVAFGTPYLPTFLQGVLTECVWMGCNSVVDTDTTNRPSLRSRIGITQGNCQAIANGNLIDATLNTSYNGLSGLLMLYGVAFPYYGAVSAQSGILWHDGSAIMVEPLIGWGNSYQIWNTGPGAAGAQTLCRGQLWDAVLISSSFAGDTTSTFDSHNWFGITDTDAADLCALFVVVP
jgi:hypothetical protein